MTNAHAHTNPWATRILTQLRSEVTGGILLVVAAGLAMGWANSPWSNSYFAIRDFHVGIAAWHLDLSIGQWASDGLLAIFFFLVGLELKRELLVGSLRDTATALVPVLAACGGVLVPALIYVLVSRSEPGLHAGWAIPTATDIAFAVAILAIVGSHLPSALRIFLLTLAVVDDVIAVAIIAVFYAESVHWTPLLAALACVAIYALIAHRFRDHLTLHKYGAWLFLLPVGIAAWAFLHASGIHATIAGVLLGFAVPVGDRRRTSHAHTSSVGLSETLDYRFRPLSAGFAVPVFAFFAAGIDIRSISSTTSVVLPLAIICGLVIGKPLGIVVTTYLVTRFTRLSRDPSIAVMDLVGVGTLGGIGFTVSLLVADLSFPTSDTYGSQAKLAILIASAIASLIGMLILSFRNRHYRNLSGGSHHAPPTS